MGSLQTMSKVAISGNASGTGTFTIQAPNSNTDRVLTLPDEAGTVLTSASDIVLPKGGPVWDMRSVSVSQDVTAQTFTKVDMNTSVVDTNSIIDLSNDRVVPDVAGYYAVSGVIRATFDTQTDLIIISIFKNGSSVQNVQYRTTGEYIENGQYVSSTTIVYCNGTTDYLELYGYLNDAGTFSNAAQHEASTFSGFLVRAA
jgi:hypothetical protein